MKSRVAHLILIALTLTILESALCYNYGRDEDRSVNQRLEHLENKIEILTNEPDKVHSVISYEISKEDQDESAQQPGITVLEVRREEEGEMIRFTVKYVSREETVEAKWFGMVGGLYKDFTGIDTAVGNDVYETSVLSPRPVPVDGSEELGGYKREHDWVGMNLDLPDDFFYMVLNLTTHETVDREIPSPRLEIEPAGDFVYHEGEELFSKIRIPLSGIKEASLIMCAALLDPGTGEVSSKCHDRVFEIVDRKQFQNYQEITARIKGTENGVSGLINLYSTIYPRNGVVGFVSRRRTIVLRPSTEEVPFPDGFLAFVGKPGPINVGSADKEVICMLGENCRYKCSAAGSDIIDITVTWIKADGTYQNLESNFPVTKTPYFRNKKVFLHVDYIPKEPEKIKCVVETAYGKLISKETTLVVSTPVDIIEEESDIVLINSTEEAASRHFEISCTVTGSPRPNVTFNIDPYDFDDEQPADDIIERGNNKYTMLKTVTYDTNDVKKRWFYLFVSCSAWRKSPYYARELYSMIYRANSVFP